MELWDLYDGNREHLGRTHVRGEQMVEGEYHIVVAIWTINTKGQILVTLRDPNKDCYPGVWENTAGSILTGENSRQGAIRELREETGIIAIEDELILIGERKEESAFVDTYLLIKDIERKDLVMQEGETVDAKWITLKDLDALIEDKNIASPVVERLGLIREKFENALENAREY